jgi:Uma2 family endonuclease
VSSPVQPRLTAEQYLERERAAGFKSECIHGVIYAITHSSSGYPGASREHNLITLNIGRERSAQLRGRPCETYASDMRVKVGKTRACVYPDVVVVCGEPRFEDAYVDTMTNPTLIVEVLSPSTQAFDRGRSSPTTGAFLRSRSISSWRSTSAASARSGC